MAQSPARLSEGLLDRAGDNAALPATAQYGVGDSHSEDRGGIAHMSRVWSCNEWDQLEEVILGNPLNARFPTADRSSQLAEFSNRSLAEIPRGPFPQRIIEETEEDLNEFARTLQGLGISVKRPETWPHEAKFSFGVFMYVLMDGFASWICFSFSASLSWYCSSA